MTMKLEELMEHSDYLKRITRRILFLILFTVLIVFIIFHLSGAILLIKRVISLFGPLWMGIVIAFILNLPMCGLEEKVFAGLNEKKSPVWEKVRRPVCLFLVVVLVLAFLGFTVFLIFPELARSLAVLTEQAPFYTRTFQSWLMEFLEKWNVTEEQMAKIQATLNEIDWSGVFARFTNFTSDIVGSVVNVTVGVTSGVFHFVMSFILAVYMLANKEMLIKNLKRVIYAFLPQRAARRLLSLGTLSNRIFAGFVSGQCTEALIVGVLCYLGMSLMGLPYPLLISTVVAITSVIPIFGAYIGAIFGGFLLILIKPLYCFMFVIYIIILQNVEGNLIYPKVVGNSVGLPALWVMLSVFVCGELFGFTGVLLGVPVFSVFYSLLKEATSKNLRKKKISDREVLANCIGAAPEPAKTELLRESAVTIKRKKKP